MSERIFCETHHIKNPRNSWGCPDCVKELRDEVERLKTQLLKIEEEEASVCPEDWGFAEFITRLKKDNHILNLEIVDADEQNAKLKSLFGEILAEIKAIEFPYCLRTGISQKTAIWLDDIEKIFETKLKEAGIIIHASDCAVHNEPAMENGDCNCQ